MRRLALGVIVGLCLQAAVAAGTSAFGVVDTPRPGDTVYGVVAVSGWVLDINAVSSIDLYVDGAKVATADINLPRVDVLNVFPTYANSPSALPGFITSFFTKKKDASGNYVYSNGDHTISVRVIESANPNVVAFRMDIPVTIDNSLNQAPIGWIDIPDPNPANTEGFDSAHPVVGWAIDDSAVDHLDILVDGQVVAGARCCNVPGDPTTEPTTAGSARYGGLRPDVHAAFPDVPDSLYSGWGGNIDTTQFINGLHVITVRVTDDQGASRVIGSRTVQTDNASLNLHPFGEIDSPLDESTIPPVCAGSSSEGGGGVPSGPPPGGTTSSCPSTTLLNTVRGWVLDTGARLDFGETGYVELLIDGVVIANTRRDCIQSTAGAFENCYGINRPDVEQNYPGFVNSDNAGFAFYFWAIDDGSGHISIDIPEPLSTCHNVTVIAPGKHDITVRAGDVAETVAPIGLGNQGPISVDFTTCVPGTNLPAFGFVDNPSNYEFVCGNLLVTGWAFDSTGFSCDINNASHIDIDVDGSCAVGPGVVPCVNVLSRAKWCIPRPDVPLADGRVTTSHVGFDFTLDTTKLADSAHDLNVYATDTAGLRTLIGRRKFVVNNNVGAPVVSSGPTPSCVPVVPVTTHVTFDGALFFPVGETGDVAAVNVLPVGSTVAVTSAVDTGNCLESACPQTICSQTVTVAITPAAGATSVSFHLQNTQTGLQTGELSVAVGNCL
jgi:Bacterial Ig domain